MPIRSFIARQGMSIVVNKAFEAVSRVQINDNEDWPSIPIDFEM
jgi:hypothetical protein